MKAAARPHRPFWRRRLLVPALALVGLNAAVFLAYTLPRLIQQRNVVSRIDALRAQVERERAFVGGLERRAETMRQNAEDMKKFYGDVLGTRGTRLVPLLREIAKTAKELGLQAGRAQYQPKEVKDAPLVRFGITMPVSGSYQQLVSFLDRIERSGQFLTVDAVSLREKQGVGEGADLDVALSTYFRAEEAGGGTRGR